MDKKKQRIKKVKKELENNCIDLKSFLMCYCGIYNESIKKEKISHKDMKILFPNLVRISFESLLEDKKNLYTGIIIAVKDSYGNVAPYINPDLQEIDYVTEVTDCEQDTITKEVEEIILNEDLSTYELSVLCKRFKDTNRTREFRIAYRLLKSKKDCKIKKYKKEKTSLRLKGREENEEY